MTELPPGLTETDLVIHADHAARRCRVCGCTDDHACVDPEFGACWWVEADLCSHCGEPAIVAAVYDRLHPANGPLTIMSEAMLLVWAARARAALGRATKVDPDEFEPRPT